MKNFIYIIIFIALFSSISNAQNFAESPKKSFAQISSGDEKFDRIFREARELMDKEEWAKAAAKFNEIACDCPANKQVDAALYWLAYCYKKQKMFKETNATIERLLKNFPDSSWADDARVLSYQTYTDAVGPGSARAGVGTARGFSGNFPATVVGQNNLLYETSAQPYSISTDRQLDREDEIKLAAFQSLLAADQKRAVEKMGELLRSDSKASENLKIQILRNLQGSRYWVNRNSSNGLTTIELTPTEVVTQINPLLRETLVKGYQSETSAKILSEILYAIANINDEASVNYLAQLYSKETNKELKKGIINSFIVVPYTAYNSFTFTGTTRAAEKPKSESEAATATASAPRPQSGQSRTETTNPVRELRFNKLMEIFRTEKDLELKRLAFNNLQRFVGWSNRDGMFDMLAQMYDAESDENFKLSIINSFGSLSNKSQTVNKLMEIAKNDKSDNLRLAAIRALRNNNSPEVIKFLEDLIK